MKLLLDVQSIRRRDPGTGMERYCLHLAQAIARNSGPHELWIGTAAQTSDLAERIFGKFVHRERIVRFDLPTPTDEIQPANQPRARAAERMREAFIADLRPDVVHISSLFEGYVDNVVTSIGAFDTDAKVATTLFDLIPHLYQDRYLPNRRILDWYQRKIQWLRNAGLILAISMHTKREALDALGIESDRIVPIYGAADAQFGPVTVSPTTRQELKKRYGINKRFLLCVNAVDPRKNTEGLIKAFALLPYEIRTELQLVIVGSMPEAAQAGFRHIAKVAALGHHDVTTTGFVPDADLKLLYNICELFIAPSLHEGLGLPVLEALACGAAVIGSELTSVPEVIGRTDALFDPKKPSAMARKMCEVLTTPSFATSLQEWGPVRARQFTWDQSARQAWDAFADLYSRPAPASSATVDEAKPLLAYLPLSSGNDGKLAEHHLALLVELSPHYDIEIVLQRNELQAAAPTPEFRVRDRSWFDLHGWRYDRVVYDLSSEYFTSGMYDLIEKRPGLVVLRDIAFGEKFHQAEPGRPVAWLQTLYEEHGIAAVREFSRTRNAAAYPCVLRIIQSAVGVIVCSADAVKAFEQSYGTAVAELVKTLPKPEAAPPDSRSVSAETEAPSGQLQSIIEQFYRSHPNARLNRLIEQIGSERLCDRDLTAIAVSAAAHRALAPPRVLLDLTLMVKHEQPAGIPRVVRNITDRLTRRPRPGVRLEGLWRAGTTWQTCSAAWERLGIASLMQPDSTVDLRRTDCLLGFDFGIEAEAANELRRRQVTIYFLLYDMLPIRRPEFFLEGLPPIFAKQLEFASSYVDGMICISRTVADDLHSWLVERKVSRSTPLHIGWFHLGADPLWTGDDVLASQEIDLLERASSRPLTLLVGSLEYRADRKGYWQTLDAFELLWGRGRDVSLAFVGQRVSTHNKLTERITHHPEFGRRLFWFESTSDRTLHKLYKSSALLLYPSHGEGFGLPLIEAARYDLPVLARDLPVFREIAGPNVTYFKGFGGTDLASAIERFFRLRDEGAVPSSAAMKPLSWEQSAEQLLAVIAEKNWYRTYRPSG